MVRQRTLGAEKLRDYLHTNRLSAIKFAPLAGIRNYAQIYHYTGKGNTIPSDDNKRAIAKATNGVVKPEDWLTLYKA